MADAITVEHRVNRRYQDGFICGCDTEIIVTLPPANYRRLTRALDMRSTHWPGKRRRRTAKPKQTPTEPPKPRGRPRKQVLTPPAPPNTVTTPSAPAEIETPEDIVSPPPQSPNTLKRLRRSRRHIKCRVKARQRQREQEVAPDVAYVVKTLRQMLFIAERKEAYHAVALRAVQGPRTTQRLRAAAILPLLRRECIEPLKQAISRLEAEQ